MSTYPRLFNNKTRFSWMEKTKRQIAFTTVNRKTDARSEFYLNKSIKFPEAKIYQTETDGSDSEWRLSLKFLWFSLNVHLCFSKKEFREWEDSNEYGYSILDGTLVIQIGRKRWSTRLPFVTTVFVRHELLNPDQSFKWAHPKVQSFSRELMDEQEKIKESISEVHPYQYILNSGEVQKRNATVYFSKDLRRAKWTPFIKSQVYMSYSFNDEVGEGTGSYKGGVMGGSIKAQPNENLEQCVRRLEATVKFSR